MHIRQLLRKQNNLFRKYKNRDYNMEDKINLDRHRNITTNSILLAKETFLQRQGLKLSTPDTAQKTYWSILKSFFKQVQDTKNTTIVSQQ